MTNRLFRLIPYVTEITKRIPPPSSATSARVVLRLMLVGWVVADTDRVVPDNKVVSATGLLLVSVVET